jgi:hypothetical protein
LQPQRYMCLRLYFRERFAEREASFSRDASLGAQGKDDVTGADQ